MAYPASRGHPAQTPYQAEAEDAVARGRLVQGMGAAVSLALVIGLGYWGYALAVRDATGIPVVRALEGPMRVAPDNPGGQIADHQGLSVTQVAADGTASTPPEQVAVAAEMTDLTDEDQPAAAMRPAPRQPAEAADAELVEADPVTRTALDEEPLPADPVAAALALAERVSEGAEPLEPGAEEAVEVAATAQTPEQTPGLARSLRPTPRPAAPVRPAVSEITEVSAPAAPEEVAASDVPVGTRMVQLGAFDSPEEAATAWAVLSAQFDTIMEGKTRVVQEAASGGQNFYRLRAMGFEDLSDARRFCAALVAERADCIPVVAR